MTTFSTTRHVLTVALCVAGAAACATAASTGNQTAGQASDSGTPMGTPPAAAPDSGAPSEDAGAEIDSSMGASSTDTDATTPPTTGPTTAPTTTAPTGTPDAGNTTPPPSGGVDGGCTMNLNCTLAPAASTGDVVQDCVNRINQFRTQCACMTPLARWTDGEACANMDAKNDGMMMSAHAGAMANICPWGEAQDECPGYPSNSSIIDQCLQQMWSEGPPPAGTTIAQCESPAMLQSCYEAHGHFINMSNPNVTKVACGFYTLPSGGIWAAKNFPR
jgi:hypothetical protein